MKVANVNDESFYKFKNKKGGKDIYVTGSHYVLNEKNNKYVQVKDHPECCINKKERKRIFLFNN